MIQGTIAIDTAVRVLEKKADVKSAKAIPDMIAKSNLDKIKMDLVLAPADFKRRLYRQGAVTGSKTAWLAVAPM